MVSKEMSEEHVRRVLADVKHPAIDRTLLDLGIIRSIKVESDNVKILLAFPFPNIPIADRLIKSVQEPLNKEGLAVEVAVTAMAEEELYKFLAMEQEGWKGGI
jgi:metal-sulfur cluster biosynthetic enzyme